MIFKGMYWIEEVLQCEFWSETSMAVLLHGAFGFSLFYKANFGVFYTLALTSLKNHMVNVLFADT